MTAYLLAAVTAFWLGILTTLSPCPMANTIAAISFISKNLAEPKQTLWGGLLYTAGRTAAYTILGFMLVKSLLSAPLISQLLQKNINILIGPVLILVGMVLLDLLSLPFQGFTISEKTGKKLSSLSLLGAFLLGILFALSFCAVPAALFFGSLLPLAVQHQSPIILPAVYGIATGLPVLLISIVLATGIHKMGILFNKLTAFEHKARQITGIIFILVGLFNALVHIFHITLP